MKTKCEYCGTEQEKAERCHRCGASLPKNNQEIRKSEPFFYNGYICYALINYMSDSREVQFWLGRELIERIVVDNIVLEQHVKEYEDPMPFFWDLFLVARGEKEVLEWQEKNDKYPTTFEIRRIENPEKIQLQELPIQELMEYYRKVRNGHND